MSTTHRMTLSFLATTLVLAACAGKDAGKPSGATPAAGAASTTPGGTARDSGASMPGAAGAAAPTALADSIRAHFRVVDGMNAEQLKAALPAHRDLIANTLSRMNSDMRQMNMPADEAWTALVDSIRQDLVHLPELSGGELKQVMPRHAGRVERLVQMHQGMMKKMKM